MASTNAPSFFASEETSMFDLGDGYWVELKKELDYGEESELEGAAIKAGIDEQGRPKMEYSLKQLRSLKLALYIEDWNLPGPSGKSVQWPQSILRRQELATHLTRKWATRIAAEIDRIRAEQGVAETISLEGLDDADTDPTVPGAATVTEPPSSSVNGGGAPTEISSAPLVALYAAPSS